MPGYPIRTPSDQRSVDNSPRTIAASHVLHRLLMPRHPPCALDNLTNTHTQEITTQTAQKQKMLASTVQFSTTTRTNTEPHHTDEAGVAVPKNTTPVRKPAGCPLRTQQCADPQKRIRKEPEKNLQACPVFPLFSSNPLPHPHHPTTTRAGTRGPPPPQQGAQDTRLKTTPPPAVTGEAP